MLRFQYDALTATGEPQSGVIEALSVDAATHELVRRGLIPVSTAAEGAASAPVGPVPETHAPAAKPLSATQLPLFTRQLATVLHTGSSLERALNMVAKSSDASAVRDISSYLSDRLRAGQALSDALAAHPDSFSKVYVAMVRAGEASGQLANSLSSLAADLEKIGELKKSLLASLIYPVILLSVSVLSLGALLGFVVPRFEAMFLEAGIALPAATQAVISVSTAVKSGWFVLPILFLSGFAAHRIWGGRPGIQRARDALALQIPVLGEVLRRYSAARLCRVLGSLSAAGVPLHQAFVWSSETLSNTHLRAQLHAVGHELRAGRGLALPLKERAVLPAMAMEMIEVGEDSGALAAMLGQAASSLDADVEARLKRVVTYAEPLIIVVLGLSIGVIVMSVFAAVISLNDLTV